MDNKNDMLTAGFVLKCIRNWYWYIPAVLIAVAIAHLMYMQSPRVWSVTGSIVVQEEKQNAAQLPEEAMMTGLPFNNRGSLNRQMQELRSRSLMEKVIDSLDIDIVYWKEGRFRDEELYKTSPILLSKVADRRAADNLSLRVQALDDTKFELIDEEDEKALEGKFGEPFDYAGNSFIIMRDSAHPLVDGIIRIEFKVPRELASWFSGRLQLRRLMQSNVLQVSLSAPTPEKLQDIIQMMVKVYNIVAQEEKNKVADKSLQFINDRLVSLNAELFSVEGQEANVRSATEVISDAGQSAERYFEQITSAEKELAQLRAAKTILLNLYNFLSDPANRYELIPNSGEIAGASLSGLITNYNRIVIQRKGQLEHATLQHPIVQDLTKNLDNLRPSILSGINLTLSDIEKKEADLSQKTATLSQKVQSTPFAQKRIKEISRQASVFNEMVLYMLQKREETAIGLATQVESVRILDDPIPGSVPDAPSRTQYYAIALLIGMAIPTGIFLAMDKLNTKVSSSEEVKALSKVPFLGEVAFAKSEKAQLVQDNVRSVNSEMFRIIRTNLHFLLPPGKDKVILVTSNESGDGKTFITGNLGATIAITNKKTVLLELDLRKPKLTELLTGEKPGAGITNYLVGDTDLEELIKPVEGYDHLYQISSGPTPPNPAELILSDKMDKLFEYLKNNFDYIIVDTPPVSLVTDTFLLNRFASATVFVIRANKTKKEDLKVIDELAEEGKLHSPAIILNSAKPSKRYGYYY
ncbi:MAG: polysaccharide biosynthesis tyrosine autokinase [Bacteroidetes bacterium]|nr:MAG: polysaccharide biosynthesis tyrosine autokinase [Bacteroidota bacterium]